MINIFVIIILILLLLLSLYLLSNKSNIENFVNKIESSNNSSKSNNFNNVIKYVDFSKLNPEEFVDLVSKSYPVIFTNVLKNKPTFESFCKKLKNKKIQVRTGNYGDTEGRKTRSFYKKKLIDYCNDKNADYGGNNKITSTELEKLNLGLNNQYYKHFRKGKMWIGRPNSKTPLHKDKPENLALQLVGNKKWTIYNSSDNKHLCYDKSNNSLEWSNYSIGDYSTCQSAKKATPIEILLKANEILYLPKQWSHQVENTTNSVMVNFWNNDVNNIPFYQNSYTVVSSIYKINNNRYENYKITLHNICKKIINLSKVFKICIFTDRNDVIEKLGSIKSNKIKIINLPFEKLPAYKLSQNIDSTMQRFSLTSKAKPNFLRQLNTIWCSKIGLLSESSKYSKTDYYIWLDATNHAYDFLLNVLNNENKLNENGIGLRKYSKKNNIPGKTWSPECKKHKVMYMAGIMAINKKKLNIYSNNFYKYMENYLETYNQFTEELLLSKHRNDFNVYNLNIKSSTNSKFGTD